MKKIATDVIASLKKIPSPDRSSGSFWDFMKEQLYSASTWDQNDLKTIEKEIGVQLDKLDNKELTELWRSTDIGMDKIDDGKKANPEEMKEDLTGEILGQVMDRMDDNYSGGSYYQSSGAFYTADEGSTGKSKSDDSDEDAGEKEPTDISDDDLALDDEDIFDDLDLTDDDDEKY